MTSPQDPTLSPHYPDSHFHSLLLTQTQSRLKKLQRRYKSSHQNLEASRNQRLVVGLVWLTLAVTFTARPDYHWAGILFLVFSVLFTVTVIRTRNRIRFHRRLENLSHFYERQKLRLLGKSPTFHFRAPFEDKIQSRDIHLFGESSVMGLIDETFSQEGQLQLARQLNTGLSTPEQIKKTQNEIQNLQKHYAVCRRLLVEAQTHQNTLSLEQLRELMSTHFTLKSYKLWAFFHALLFPAYLVTFVMIGEGHLKAPLALPVVAYAVFSLVSLRSLVAAFRQGEILERSLETLLPVLTFVERHPRVFGELLPSLKTKKFSTATATLKRYVSFLSIQSHGLAYIIVNGLCPWTFFWTGLTEAWRKKHQQHFLSILTELRTTEVLMSLGTFYHYQSRTLPDISSAHQGLKTEQAYHPLISRTHVVANSVEIAPGRSLVLLTGSNMSGKSTFMRTLALNQTLALAGAPVFAKAWQAPPAPVLTCMQVEDSLNDGYSYFFAEVKRVKEILDHLTSGKPGLFFVDEIFKGTNNRERLLGSKALIERIASLPQALGVISTHDLELATLSNELKPVQNFHFRDEVSEDALVFTYQLHPGPCPTTNALKIMKAQGLPVG